MPLTPEQVKELKEQLKSQITHLPIERKAQAEAQIEALSPEALELMIKQQQAKTLKAAEKSIFRLIANKEVNSYIIKENEKAIAVLDINPISRGHTLVIPKEPVITGKPLPNSIFSFSQKLSKVLEKSLKAKTVEIQTENKFGETIIHLIPIYDLPLSINSERHPAKPEELEKVLLELSKKKVQSKSSLIKQQKKSSQVLKLPRRIP